MGSRPEMTEGANPTERGWHTIALAFGLVLLCVWPIAAQPRTAAQFCTGTSTLRPPAAPSQASGGGIGAILPGTYILVICSIDSSGKYSAPSSPIVAAVSAAYYLAGSISFATPRWDLDTAGYELFIGVPLGSDSAYSTPSAAQLAILTSYLGPQMVGSNLKMLPNTIEVDSIPLEALPPGVRSLPYSQPTGAINGKITAGALPPGLSLNTAPVVNGASTSTGTVSGTPTSSGSFAFSLTVTSATAQPSTATQQFALTISEPLKQFTVTPSAVRFSASQADLELGKMVSQAVAISSVQNVGNFACTVASSQPWITGFEGGPNPRPVPTCPTTLLVVLDDAYKFQPSNYTAVLTLAADGFASTTIPVTLTITASPTPVSSNAPIVQAVTNGGSGGSVSFNSLISIWGKNLSTGAQSTTSFPWPTSLGNTQVSFCDASRSLTA